MVILVFVADIVQDFKRFLSGSGLYQNLLEATLKSAILLDILTILVECRCANALNFTACQCRLEHIGGVQRPTGTTGAHDGMDFVNKQYYIRVVLQLVEHRLHTLLELATVFCAGHQRRQVERNDTLVVECAGHAAFDDALGKAFGDGRLAYAGLTDKHGVVLLAATQNLRNTLQLTAATDNGVKATFLGGLGQVAAKVLEGRRFAVLAVLVALRLAFGIGIRKVILLIVTHLKMRLVAAALLLAGTLLVVARVLQQPKELIVVYAVAIEQTRRHIFALHQYGQHKVLGLDFRGFHLGRLQESQTQHLLRLLEHRYLALLAVCYVGLLTADCRLNAALHFRHIDANVA